MSAPMPQPLSPLRRSALKLAAATLAAAALPAVAQAPAWPTKAVRIVVGVAPDPEPSEIAL